MGECAVFYAQLAVHNRNIIIGNRVAPAPQGNAVAVLQSQHRVIAGCVMHQSDDSAGGAGRCGRVPGLRKGTVLGRCSARKHLRHHGGMAADAANVAVPDVAFRRTQHRLAGGADEAVGLPGGLVFRYGVIALFYHDSAGQKRIVQLAGDGDAIAVIVGAGFPLGSPQQIAEPSARSAHYAVVAAGSFKDAAVQLQRAGRIVRPYAAGERSAVDVGAAAI